MANELPLSCSCGTMRGRARDVGPRRTLRLICHCRDCQAFAHFLEQRGHQGLLLDAWGGTDVVQMPPARIELTAGAEQLACMRLSDKGLMRWYARCCHTPIANTLPNAKVPFAGVMLAFVDVALDEGARERLLGPARARVNGNGEFEGESAPKFDGFPLGTILRSFKVLLGGWMRGEQWPTPFFDAGAHPLATPEVVSLEARTALNARVDAGA